MRLKVYESTFASMTSPLPIPRGCRECQDYCINCSAPPQTLFLTISLFNVRCRFLSKCYLNLKTDNFEIWTEHTHENFIILYEPSSRNVRPLNGTNYLRRKEKKWLSNPDLSASSRPTASSPTGPTCNRHGDDAIIQAALCGNVCSYRQFHQKSSYTIIWTSRSKKNYCVKRC